MPEPTRRAILMLKEAHPDWGQDRLHDVLLRSRGLRGEPGGDRAGARGGGLRRGAPGPRPPHEPQGGALRAAAPNQLWQTDLFTFVLKRENRRVHLVAFMDDHSRFIVGYGLHASASGALVREVLEAAIANFGAPEEVLTDNGTQYETWRGTSAFTAAARAPRDPADRGGAAASADARQDRALLGDAVARVPREGDLPGDRRRAASHRAVHRLLQLPAPAPGDRRRWCRRTGSSQAAAGGEGDALGAGREERGGARAKRRAEEALLSDGSGGRPSDLAPRRGREGGADGGGEARGGGLSAPGRRAEPDGSSRAPDAGGGDGGGARRGGSRRRGRDRACARDVAARRGGEGPRAGPSATPRAAATRGAGCGRRRRVRSAAQGSTTPAGGAARAGAREERR